MNVYDANMSREDYALVGLLCGGDYDMVSGFKYCAASLTVLNRQGCLAVALRLQLGLHVVAWDSPCSQLSVAVASLVRIAKHGAVTCNGTCVMTPRLLLDAATQC